METTLHIIISASEWGKLMKSQELIVQLLRELRQAPPAIAAPAYITAIEFMQAVRIGRTKFDQLVAANKVKTTKRGRKIYVPVGEVERYFKSV
jgi:hypothetical protein